MKIEYVAESLGLPCIVGTEIEPGFGVELNEDVLNECKYKHL